MIRSLLTLTVAAMFCVLVAGCDSKNPEDAAHDKGPRPAPTTPQQADGPGAGADISQGSAPGGGAKPTTPAKPATPGGM